MHKPTKKPTYARDVQDIALNDEPTLLDLTELSSQVTVVMTGWRWGLEAEEVAADVIAYRMKYNK